MKTFPPDEPDQDCDVCAPFPDEGPGLEWPADLPVEPPSRGIGWAVFGGGLMIAALGAAAVFGLFRGEQ